MKRANRNALITLVVALVIFALFMALPSIRFPTSTAKWRADMPDDGAMLCLSDGEGFKVTNNPWGYHVDRYEAFDVECAKRMK